MKQRFPQRKPTRLPGYDYGAAGAYFITICTKNKHCILGMVAKHGILDAPFVELSPIGKLVEAALEYLNVHSKYISVEKHVIMPNHIHLILLVRGRKNEESGASRMPRPTNTAIPAFLSSLKRLTNRQAGRAIWQSGYYDHIIRDEEDYLRIWRYIDENPAKWTEDKYFET